MGRVGVVVLWGVSGLSCGRTGLLVYDEPDAGLAAGNGGRSDGQSRTGGSGGVGSSSGVGGFALGGAGGGGAAGTMNVAGGGSAGMSSGGFAGVSVAGGGGETPNPGIGEIPEQCGSFASNPGITSPTAPCAVGRATYSVLIDGRHHDMSRSGDFTSVKNALARCNFDGSTWFDTSLTRDGLSAFDVLLFLPKRGVMPEEDNAAVREFIQNGGSVLVFSDYASNVTSSVEEYQSVLDLVGAVHGDTSSGVGPTFPRFTQHPITEGVLTFSVYAATTLSGEGYVPIAALGCPIFLAKDTGANRFVVSGDATPIYGHELRDYDNERLFHQALEWLVRER